MYHTFSDYVWLILHKFLILFSLKGIENNKKLNAAFQINARCSNIYVVFKYSVECGPMSNIP